MLDMISTIALYAIPVVGAFFRRSRRWALTWIAVIAGLGVLATAVLWPMSFGNWRAGVTMTYMVWPATMLGLIAGLIAYLIAPKDSGGKPDRIMLTGALMGGVVLVVLGMARMAGA